MEGPFTLLQVRIWMGLSYAAGATTLILAAALGWLDPIRPAPVNPKPAPKEWGEFLAPPQVELQDNGRDLRLLKEFTYVDPDKKTWVAPKDSVVDGASIPQVFWSIAGGPLEGTYRNASIVHDVECDRKQEPSEDVHYMFYEACRCGGLPDNKAKVLYWAVYHFGPHWKIEHEVKSEVKTRPDGTKYTVAIDVKVPVPTVEVIAPADEETARKIQKIIDERNPSIEDLKKIYPGELR
jgi:Protein of unknown function (DUF1353)